MIPELIVQIIELCIIPLLGVLTKFLVDLINAKRDEIKSRAKNEKTKKYIDMIHDTVRDCVIATEQAYVTDLKKAGKFDLESQKQALQHTLDAVITVLDNDALEYVKETTSDINEYLTHLIEAEISKNKI